ncbi:MAG: hypothetical protein A3H93_06425 [Rhodocyclales bacterium RIFCSPLOWO2_02_FULL_63_24]|nr:MAG: hypothetical protein A2040_10055 [Rhodocyclales bacterium GWA2_65_19]OHC68531.1 MAG: hypothetical protein A3H93_06425 [Rhodocyclales bacterium RIFCSPLOWO2_02_FULL_63_24]
MRFVVTLLVGLLLATAANALSLADISGRDASGGLKEALTQGAAKAVAVLGRPDGFLGNPKVRIPLPESVQKIEGVMRGLGMGKQADELLTAMNRAAEAAVPQAKLLLVNSIKQMSVEDAKGILSGGEDAATQYFRRTTSGPLAEKFVPVVRKAITRVKLAEKYDQVAGKAAKLGLVREQDAHLENYVTQKTLDGLYLMIAEEEKAIRKNPADAVGRLAKKVFGALN